MRHRLSVDVIRAAIIVIVSITIATGSLLLMPAKSGNVDALELAGARGGTGMLVLAQYNPCPGGKCK